MSDQPHLTTWDRWSWPTFYAGTIALGIVLHLTTQLPVWALVITAAGLTATYLCADRHIKRRRTHTT